MKLEIDRPHVEALLQAFPRLGHLQDQLRFGNKAEVSFHQLERSELNFLGELYNQGGPQLQTRAAQLATLQQALNDDGPRFTPDDLEDVVPAIARYLLNNAIRGWLFTANVSKRPLPYVVTRIDYTPASNDETGKVFIELKANAKGSIMNLTLRINASDIVGKTIGEIFASKGF
jgi:hypothetical protein